MTENEALKLMESLQISHDCEMVKTLDFKGTVIKALEDLQQYRELGTVEEILKVFNNQREIISMQHETVKQYRAIGTVEECRVAVERMKPKKYARKGGNYDCPVCGYFIFTSTGIKNKYCSNCGQAIDWSE